MGHSSDWKQKPVKPLLKGFRMSQPLESNLCLLFDLFEPWAKVLVTELLLDYRTTPSPAPCGGWVPGNRSSGELSCKWQLTGDSNWGQQSAHSKSLQSPRQRVARVAPQSLLSLCHSLFLCYAFPALPITC